MKTFFAWVLILSVVTAADPITIKTLKGKEYTGVKVTGHDEVGLKIQHSEGAAKIPFEDLPIEMRQQYNYDPAKAAATKASQDAVRRAESAKAAKKEWQVANPPWKNYVKRVQEEANPHWRDVKDEILDAMKKFCQAAANQGGDHKALTEWCDLAARGTLRKGMPVVFVFGAFGRMPRETREDSEGYTVLTFGSGVGTTVTLRDDLVVSWVIRDY